jgi:hypothetical protein
MAQDYPLEELSPRAFEQLTVALGLEVLGNGVTAFGSGPDGGREAEYVGPVEWSATTGFGADSWNGRVVLQAKQREHLSTPASNAKWLIDRIDSELDEWVRDDSSRGAVPDYLIFVTNVRLSSVPGTGGIDRVHGHVWERRRRALDKKGRDSLAARGLRDVKIWHRDQINGLLTKYQGIRQGFKGLLTVGDLVARLGELNGLLDPAEFEPFLTTHAKMSLGSERWVNLREAGGTTRESVDEVVVDLKAHGTYEERLTLLEEVIQRSDQVLKPSFIDGPRHLVLTGQPGSGKSTITLFVNQLQRTAFLAGESLTPTAQEVQAGTARALARLGLRPPRNRRWPLRVSLADYADVLGPTGEKTLMRWLSEKINSRAEIDIMPKTLRRWIQHWPSLVILDGLDEVTAPEVRPRVLDEIRTFIEEAEHDDADLFVIITTRPTGYTERILPEQFSQVDLAYLDAASATAYGRHVTSRRLVEDPDARDLLIDRFERESRDARIQRLMKTPLQVLIMTLILETFGSLPADRYQLFLRYFDTVYQREQAKITSLTPLLTGFRQAIVDLHEAVGFALQVQSETSSGERAVLPQSELRVLAIRRLVEIGHTPGPEVERIAAQIVQAATERLVLLVPAEDDGVAFEIRSLQELMAARFLGNSTDRTIRTRMIRAAPSPHWRNTVIFLAGRLFFEGPDHRRDLVIEVIEQADESAGWPGWLAPVSAELAAGLLDDGMAASMPKWQQRLINLALTAMDGPMPPNSRTIAIGLSGAASGHNLIVIRDAIRAALGGTPLARAIAADIETQGSFGQLIRADWKSPSRPRLDTVITGRPIAELLAPTLIDLDLDADTQAGIDKVMEELAGFRITDKWNANVRPLRATLPAQLPLTLAGLRNADVAAALELAFTALGPEHWTSSAVLSQLVWPSLARVAIGPEL